MNIITLDKLPINTLGKVCNINCNESVKRRLLDLGLIKGTAIAPVFKSPFGNPVAYEIRGTIIALRKCDTRCIYVEMNCK